MSYVSCNCVCWLCIHCKSEDFSQVFWVSPPSKPWISTDIYSPSPLARLYHPVTIFTLILFQTLTIVLSTSAPTVHPALMGLVITLATAQQASPEHIAKRVSRSQRKNMLLHQLNLQALIKLRVLTIPL